MLKTIQKSAQENLRFLCVELDAQLELLQRYLVEPSIHLARRIRDRRGYAENLKLQIHSTCHEGLLKQKQSERLRLRSLELIATELERMAEQCRDCVDRREQISNPRIIDAEALVPLLRRQRSAIAMIQSAWQDNDSQKAIKLGQAESKLAKDCAKLKRQVVADLKRKQETEDLVAALFLLASIEHMSDALLTISESLLSGVLGQVVNLERFASLQASMRDLSGSDDASTLQLDAIAETRSGSTITGISATDAPNDHYLAIFKDGEKRKLKEERKGVQSWHEIYPGLAPRILSYQKRGKSAALLIEHLPGQTFEQILLHENAELLEESLQALSQTLCSVWSTTRAEQSVSANFVEQLTQRMEAVYRIHPEFQQGKASLCGLELLPFDTLLKRARRYEKAVKAPFSVYIHGDFNVDNIIYDPVEERINFIDLHRSRYMDYVQDVSVFMVSNDRLQIQDAPIRRRIAGVIQQFYELSQNYAREQKDESFELRMALGLARSYASSTRFILDKSLARSMFMRARYLLEQVLATPIDQAATYRLPITELFRA